MLPICRYFVPHLQFQPSGFPPENEKKFLNLLATAKLLATNAKQATNAFLQSKFSLFDPIVHDNSCQIRAFRVITLASCKEILEEAQKLKTAATQIEKTLDRLRNKPKIPVQELSFEALLSGLNLSLEASSEMCYLLQAHFLTVGKVFQVKPDGSETAYIDYSTLQHRVSKQIEIGLLKRIVDFTQVKLAQASVSFIQAEADHIGGLIGAQLAEDQIAMISPPGEGSLARPCSCTFYNFKALLLRAQQEHILLFVKRYAHGKEASFGVFYRARDFAPLPDEEMAQLNPKTPVLVLEGFLPASMDPESLQKQIDEISLLDLALVNAARVTQFSNVDIDPAIMIPAAYQELKGFRNRAEQLGCNLKEPRVFSIVHTYAEAAGVLR